jgi:hypothetical protein
MRWGRRGLGGREMAAAMKLGGGAHGSSALERPGSEGKGQGGVGSEGRVLGHSTSAQGHMTRVQRGGGVRSRMAATYRAGVSR